MKPQLIPIQVECRSTGGVTVHTTLLTFYLVMSFFFEVKRQELIVVLFESVDSLVSVRQRWELGVRYGWELGVGVAVQTQVKDE